MSLQTDRFFAIALKESEVNDLVEDRIFNPARDIEAEDEDKIPYIIISLDSVTNNIESKDDEGESMEDTAVVSVLCVADDREGLATLTESVRDAIKDAYDNWTQSDTTEFGFILDDYQFAANGVQMDVDKPCVYQTLTYTCTTTNY